MHGNDSVYLLAERNIGNESEEGSAGCLGYLLLPNSLSQNFGVLKPELCICLRFYGLAVGMAFSVPCDVSCAHSYAFGQLVCQLGYLVPDVLTDRSGASALMPGPVSLCSLSP